MTIGASRSVLMARIALAERAPTMCWIAPLMPQAMYRSGAIRVPVWPTCWACGRQPADVTTRETPTVPPSSAASSSSWAKPSALPTPRPPPTTTRASASEIAPASAGTREVIRTRKSRSVERPARTAGRRSSRDAAAGAVRRRAARRSAAGSGPSSRGLLEQAAAPALARDLPRVADPHLRAVRGQRQPASAPRAWAMTSAPRSLPGADDGRRARRARRAGPRAVPIASGA